MRVIVISKLEHLVLAKIIVVDSFGFHISIWLKIMLGFGSRVWASGGINRRTNAPFSPVHQSASGCFHSSCSRKSVALFLSIFYVVCRPYLAKHGEAWANSVCQPAAGCRKPVPHPPPAGAENTAAHTAHTEVNLSTPLMERKDIPDDLKQSYIFLFILHRLRCRGPKRLRPLLQTPPPVSQQQLCNPHTHTHTHTTCWHVFDCIVCSINV